MYRRLLFLFILFYSLCLSVQAQTDSTKQKRWNFGIGVLTGVNQLHPSTQLHYETITNYVDGAVFGEAVVCYHYNSRWSILSGLRFGTYSTYSIFNHAKENFDVLIKKVTLGIPLTICFKIENTHKKEIVSVETGILAGEALHGQLFNTSTNLNFYKNTQASIRSYGNHIGLPDAYYAGIIRLERSIPIAPDKGIKVSMEYDLSIYNQPIDISLGTYPNTEQDMIRLRYNTLYLGLYLIF